jgi:hypothetical protein
MSLRIPCIVPYQVQIQISSLISGNDDRPGVYFRQWVRNYWISGVLVRMTMAFAYSGILPSVVTLRPFTSYFPKTLLRILSPISYRHGHNLLHWSIYPCFSPAKSRMVMDIGIILGLRSQSAISEDNLDKYPLETSESWLQCCRSPVFIW